MKETKSVSFAKATITKEDGVYVITEYNKDDVATYTLNTYLDDWIGIENISLSIKKDFQVPSEE